MSSKPKSKLPKTKPRNSNALSAKSRVAGMVPMKSKNAPRGGQKNEQRELLEDALEEAEDFDYEFENCNCDNCRDGFPYIVGGTVERVRFIEPYHIVWVIDHTDDSQHTLVYRPDSNSTKWETVLSLNGYKLTGDNAREQIEKLLVLV